MSEFDELEAERETADHWRDLAEQRQKRIYELAAEVNRVKDENENLRGLRPELPPRHPEGEGLPRFGLRWNGPSNPLAVSMEDGYWTPWHLAEQARNDAQRYRGMFNDQYGFDYDDRWVGKSKNQVDAMIEENGHV